MARKTFIAGNWKMNTTLQEAVELARGVVEKVGGNTDVDVAVCPPYTNLAAVAEVVKGSPVKLGAQDVHWEEKGAYTGKVSCAMLKSVGVELVIIGHSEQRTYFGETNETVNKKVKAALAAGLLPIICVGETLDERKGGKMEAVVESHVRGAFDGVSKDDALKCTIAYEPVWAIGTGETATPQQAQEAHAFIRGLLESIYDGDAAQAIRIQYGGSMKPSNAAELLANPDVDGGLIGGAALKPDDFAGIVFPQ
ncbi:MAG: triose-phosphate isomerase [Chitinivibrionales bacterium]|nr:triose-phosphate isomerase [Chitinivibrionales bacterium]